MKLGPPCYEISLHLTDNVLQCMLHINSKSLAQDVSKVSPSFAQLNDGIDC